MGVTASCAGGPQEPTGELDPVEVEKQKDKKKKELQRLEWRRMMEESREKQESLLKAEEIKNAAKKARIMKHKKVEKGLTDVRNFWKKKEFDLAGKDTVEKVIKDPVVKDRKRKAMEDTGQDRDLVEGRKRSCLDGNAAATTVVVKKESETDMKNKIKKLIINNYQLVQAI